MDTRQAHARQGLYSRHGQIQPGDADGLAGVAVQRRAHQERSSDRHDRIRAMLFEIASHREANEALQNWGRYVHDGWLRDNLLFTPPPTSEGYRAPIVGFDEPEPARMPIDELDAQRTEHIVIYMGLHHFDYHRVLVYWYPSLLIARRDMLHADCVKRLSKHMHCSFAGAERMLRDSVARFSDMRLSCR